MSYKRKTRKNELYIPMHCSTVHLVQALEQRFLKVKLLKLDSNRLPCSNIKFLFRSVHGTAQWPIQAFGNETKMFCF